jgi:hypothetical protein
MPHIRGGLSRGSSGDDGAPLAESGGGVSWVDSAKVMQNCAVNLICGHSFSVRVRVHQRHERFLRFFETPHRKALLAAPLLKHRFDHHGQRERRHLDRIPTPVTDPFGVRMDDCLRAVDAKESVGESALRKQSAT